MKKYLKLSILLLTCVANQGYCSWLDEYQPKIDCPGVRDPHKNNVHYNVYRGAPERRGFENTSPGYIDKAETFGDTTYHTLSPIPTRRGFGNL